MERNTVFDKIVKAPSRHLIITFARGFRHHDLLIKLACGYSDSTRTAGKQLVTQVSMHANT